jgi:hypothetical protein
MPPCPEAPQLVGFKLGNHYHQGVLTRSTADEVRIHSCERGAGCPVLNGEKKMIRIMPIVTRTTDGEEIQELGIGGGQGDLDQITELDMQSEAALNDLKMLCSAKIPAPETLESIYALLDASYKSREGRVRLGLALDGSDQFDLNEDTVGLDQLVGRLTALVKESDGFRFDGGSPAAIGGLENTITFPYSRHSSYSEMCALVAALKPKDVYPCTVDEEKWTLAVSMRSLFGHLCSGDHFAHDEEMLNKHAGIDWTIDSFQGARSYMASSSSEASVSFETAAVIAAPNGPVGCRNDQEPAKGTAAELRSPSSSSDYQSGGLLEPQSPAVVSLTDPAEPESGEACASDECHMASQAQSEASIEEIPPSTFEDAVRKSKSTSRNELHINGNHISTAKVRDYSRKTARKRSASDLVPWEASSSSKRANSIAEWAYDAVLGLDSTCDSWHSFGGLRCVRRPDSQRSVELGEPWVGLEDDYEL